MGRLTEAKRQILQCCLDWSAPFEVAERRRYRGVNVFARQTSRQLSALQKDGLLEYGQANNVYRITDLGRAALAQPEEKK